ncbi:hypothetical protein, partial [Heyndrickxia coagulans]|uniref:hypothetical protein n=1 Tax=Heyndrickxia coagulans TaxID=1398 RepID=UPI00214D211C
FLSTPYFFIIFACFPLFLGGKFFYPFFKPLGYKESVTSQLPPNIFFLFRVNIRSFAGRFFVENKIFGLAGNRFFSYPPPIHAIAGPIFCFSPVAGQGIIP